MATLLLLAMLPVVGRVPAVEALALVAGVCVALILYEVPECDDEGSPRPRSGSLRSAKDRPIGSSWGASWSL